MKVGPGIGRIRLRRIDDASAASLQTFIEEAARHILSEEIRGLDNMVLQLFGWDQGKRAGRLVEESNQAGLFSQ